MIKRLRMGLNKWLLALTLLAFLPLLLFSVYSIFELSRSMQELIRTELLQRTQSTADMVNVRLGLDVGYLNALSTSNEAMHDDLPALYSFATRIVAMNPDASSISLVSSDYRILFRKRSINPNLFRISFQ